VVFTTYVVDVDTSLLSEEGAHSPSGQAGLLSSSYHVYATKKTESDQPKIGNRDCDQCEIG
jgi:hypothetical protein